MNLTGQIARHFREVYFGGNWTASSLQEHLAEMNWQQAVTLIPGATNTIATLLFHIHYYVHAVLGVLQGKPLEAKDKYSFDCPPVLNEEDWEKMLETIWADAENFASEVEKLPENQLWAVFAEEKYGTYYRNLTGVIEHSHYHLGQIVLLKKMLLASKKPA